MDLEPTVEMDLPSSPTTLVGNFQNNLFHHLNLIFREQHNSLGKSPASFCVGVHTTW